jgi:hypothetical protein
MLCAPRSIQPKQNTYTLSPSPAEAARTSFPRRWSPTSKPWQNIAVRAITSTKRKLLSEYLEKVKPAVVGAPEWAVLKEALAPVADSYLRKLLRESGSRLAPLIEGVRQSDFDELERTLVALSQLYSAGDRETRRVCRRAAIEAKQHARWTARRAGPDEAKRHIKEEMIQWMLVWLENPAVFPAWAPLRRKNW